MIITLSIYRSRCYHLGSVQYWVGNRKWDFLFLTNIIDISAFQVTELYMNRWQVEISLTKLIFNMTKTKATLMSQIYLIFNNVPILIRHKRFITAKLIIFLFLIWVWIIHRPPIFYSYVYLNQSISTKPVSESLL